MQPEEAIAHFKRGVVSQAGNHVIAIDECALRVNRGKCPEIAVVFGRIAGIGSVVLGHRLHRPANRPTGRILHDRMKENLRRFVANANLARILQTCCRIGGAIETHRAGLILRHDAEFVFAVIQHIRDRPSPMLVVAMAFWERPEFVTSVVNPLAHFRGCAWRKVLALVFGIHKKVVVTVEADLHEPAAELRHDC